MIELTLEEDLPQEFMGGTLRIGSENKLNDTSKAPTPAVVTPADKADKDSTELNGNRCHWRNAFIAPFSSIPNKITETIWSSKSKEITPSVSEKSLQTAFYENEDANNFFTFRDGVIDRAVKECTSQFLDLETEGPVHGSFLLTQINHWDTDKERLVLLTAKSLVLVKYDFIALKRLDYKKIPLDDIEGIIIGNLVYPNGSLIPDRNMKGLRLLFTQEKPENLASKWNPFKDDVPFWTFTFHPLYFHKDCTNERLRSLYNLETFIEQLCVIVNKNHETTKILQHNIILENYIGLGSLIHNRNSLGFFKVRGKFSF